ncbi:MAG TPA: ABATE domain-containing protein [Pseudonocardia sp.]|uniref:CGNR zinc finger domain-containing protein n=1 Tax=Pseudonocardia sp. TaxID=60912 RepID=UPI002B4B647E|nr:ABATE domain-containing protein [Pseudonocardia sp.]HLU60171.1 ABATE domain-containing protein [Pseudonocardia sp.]
MRQDWIWHGGRPCLDLVNTLRDRWSASPRELLATPADLAEWLHAAQLVDHPVEVDAHLLAAARELREAVDRVLRAAQPRAEDVAVVDGWARRAVPPPARLRLDADGRLHADVPPAADGADRALALVAADAVALVAAGALGQVRICAHERCGLRFLDRSPARNRQWCSMRRCGNRTKVSRHHARRTAAR